MTIKDVIEHLQTMPPDMEVWVTWDESGEYWPATEPQGRVDWVHRKTRTDGRTRWVESFTAQGQKDGTGKAVCVLLSNISSSPSPVSGKET
jgi:hypothetical protein